MAFVVSIRQLSIMGASTGANVTLPAFATTGAAQNITIPIPQPGSFHFGMLRVKSLTPATGTMTVGAISVSDGTNTAYLQGAQPAITLPADHTVFPLVTDLNATSLILALTTSAAGTVDIEFAGI
jgi:hypothetical protein